MSWIALLCTLAALVIAGIIPTLGKLALAELDPWTLIAGRQILALLALLALARASGHAIDEQRPLRASDWLRLACVAWLGCALPLALLAFGMQRSTATSAALLSPIEAIAIWVGGALWLRRRVGRARWIAAALGAAGTTAIVLSGADGPAAGPLRGDLMICAGHALSAIYTLAARPLVARHTAARVSLWAAALSVPPVLAMAALEPARDAPSLSALGWVCALALASAALAWWSWHPALALPARRSAPLLFVAPLVGLAAGVLLLGEKSGALAAIGTALMLGGVTWAAMHGDPEGEDDSAHRAEASGPEASLAEAAPLQADPLALDAQPEPPAADALEPTTAELEPITTGLEPATAALEPITSELEPATAAPTRAALEPFTAALERARVAMQRISAAPKISAAAKPSAPRPNAALEPTAELERDTAPEPGTAAPAPTVALEPARAMLAPAPPSPAPTHPGPAPAPLAGKPAKPVEELVALHEIVAAARARLADSTWHYLVGGSETETTVARNRRSLDSLALRPRVLRDVSEIDPSVALLGRRLRIPVVLAPIGGLESLHPDGALASARAAERFGTAYLQSSVCAPALEETAAASAAPCVFQLYVRGDSAWTDAQVERALASRCAAFCITVDTAIYSRRERDGVTQLVKPWRERATGRQYQAALSWKYVEHYKQRFALPLVIKGIATAQDALLACEHGVDVVYVSNHGGRQLDHGRGAIAVLPEVVDAVAGRAQVWVDGGFCRGTDVVKALALGAQLVGVGRLHGYGMAAGGESGVVRTLELLETEICTALGLLGVTRVSELDRSYVERAEPLGSAHALGAFPMLDFDPRGLR